MRIGDFLELKEKEIKTIEDKVGNSYEVLEFNQQKTGGRVVVPIPNVGLNIIKNMAKSLCQKAPNVLMRFLKS